MVILLAGAEWFIAGGNGGDGYNLINFSSATNRYVAGGGGGGRASTFWRSHLGGNGGGGIWRQPQQCFRNRRLVRQIPAAAEEVQWLACFEQLLKAAVARRVPGIVIIRYPGTTVKATGGSISTVSVGGQNYVVHEFTGSDTFKLI